MTGKTLFEKVRDAHAIADLGAGKALTELAARGSKASTPSVLPSPANLPT